MSFILEKIQAGPKTWDMKVQKTQALDYWIKYIWNLMKINSAQKKMETNQALDYVSSVHKATRVNVGSGKGPHLKGVWCRQHTLKQASVADSAARTRDY